MSTIERFQDALAAPTLASASESAQASSSSPLNTFKRYMIVDTVSPMDSSQIIDWKLITQTSLIPHSNGLTSTVYRRMLNLSATWPLTPTCTPTPSNPFAPLNSANNAAHAVQGWICIKRSDPDQQPRPHSISREIALLQKLPQHDNLVRLYSAIYDTTHPFASTIDLVMPLYAATLEQVLQEPTLYPPSIPLPLFQSEPRPALSISHLWNNDTGFADFVQSTATQLLSGLAFLHANKVAHRDIKPCNILFATQGTLKLIDLGTAYTTLPLLDPLSSKPKYLTPELDDAQGNEPSMVCQVGTGGFRAIELLFAPTRGYDAYKVDVWSAGVVLAHFFTCLVPICAFKSSSSNHSRGQENVMPNLDVDSNVYDASGSKDERREWQRAFDDSKPLELSDDDQDDLYWEEEEEEEESSDRALQLDGFTSLSKSESGYIRAPLFESDKGDISLAASIFGLLGLPNSVFDWPEAEYFQPSLHRLPFAATKGKGLVQGLPIYKALQDKNEAQAAGLEKLVHQVIQKALRISASQRPTAQELLDSFQAT
ncbi:related to SGV1 - Cyclin-dependent protein kinase [Melanopsichium pennsylvanicum]|uniref:Related to SGV1 - Cyclin-dependent protein kinase n=2 Tax=Melanopsichium pennsylvanicum TaxID=63383 RepID=A0AAJ4XKV0_9BASI|nr:cmgc cdk protein kinase [Melanopsichium pennsylvanicum 4]SNX83636.1 related to SGV1 - Cyclin-dependent protein kinase [Melanopsichium pennsylvanicum]